MVHTQNGRETMHPQKDHNPGTGNIKHRECQKDKKGQIPLVLTCAQNLKGLSSVEQKTERQPPQVEDLGQKVQRFGELGRITDLHSIVTAV